MQQNHVHTSLQAALFWHSEPDVIFESKMKVFHNNVIMSVLLTHCDPVTKIALRTMSTWLARFIKPSATNLSDIVGQANVFEACILDRSVFRVTTEKCVSTLLRVVIASDNVTNYVFLKRRVLLKSAWVMRWHTTHHTIKYEFKEALQCESIGIMEYLLPYYIGNIEKSIDLFWMIIYCNVHTDQIQWILNRIPYICAILKHDAPVFDPSGCTIDHKHFVNTVAHLKNVLTFAMFEKWMLMLAKEAKRVDLVKIIGSVIESIPGTVCKYLSRTNPALHERLFPICGHVKKPEKKKSRTSK